MLSYNFLWIMVGLIKYARQVLKYIDNGRLLIVIGSMLKL